MPGLDQVIDRDAECVSEPSHRGDRTGFLQSFNAMEMNSVDAGDTRKLRPAQTTQLSIDADSGLAIDDAVCEFGRNGFVATVAKGLANSLTLLGVKNVLRNGKQPFVFAAWDGDHIVHHNTSSVFVDSASGTNCKNQQDRPIVENDPPVANAKSDQSRLFQCLDVVSKGIWITREQLHLGFDKPRSVHRHAAKRSQGRLGPTDLFHPKACNSQLTLSQRDRIRLASLQLACVISVSTVFGSADRALAMTIDPRTRGVMEFIGALEAPRGYNDYFGGVAEPPPKQLTTMTIDEVLAWQDGIDARSISEAAGRYQIMEDTLRGLKRRMGLKGDELFDIKMQDRLAVELMGMAGWHPDRDDHEEVANALAKVWAALPLVSGDNEGRSAYHDLAGNKALTTPELYLEVIRRGGDAGVVEAALKESGRAVRARVDAPVRIAARADSEQPVKLRRSAPTGFDATMIEGGRLEPSKVLVFANDPFAME